ncbi:MAG: hypothetical protein WD153_03095 [Candidatus Paceibacterota bacterium]
MGLHGSHVTRMSDASSFDEICVNCGATDTIGGWGRLAEPCSKSVKDGGMTIEEWAEKDKERIKRIAEQLGA